MENNILQGPNQTNARIIGALSSGSRFDHIRDAINQSGHQVTIIDNEDEAVAAIRDEVFNLVISFLYNSEEENLSFLKKVKDYAPQVEVIFLTERPNESGRWYALAQGAFEYLPLDIERDRLIQTIQDALYQSGLSLSLSRLLQEKEIDLEAPVQADKIPFTEIKGEEAPLIDRPSEGKERLPQPESYPPERPYSKEALAEIERLKKRIEELQESSKEDQLLKEKVETLVSERKEYEEEAGREIDRLRTRIRELQEASKEDHHLKEKVDSLMFEKEGYEDTIAGLKAEISRLNSQVKSPLIPPTPPFSKGGVKGVDFSKEGLRGIEFSKGEVGGVEAQKGHRLRLVIPYTALLIVLFAVIGVLTYFLLFKEGAIPFREGAIPFKEEEEIQSYSYPLKETPSLPEKKADPTPIQTDEGVVQPYTFDLNNGVMKTVNYGVKLYNGPGENYPYLRTLSMGEEVIGLNHGPNKGKRYVSVKVNRGSVRAGPSMNYPRVSITKRGRVFEAVDSRVDERDVKWSKVRRENGEFGWISNKLLKSMENIKWIKVRDATGHEGYVQKDLMSSKTLYLLPKVILLNGREGLNYPEIDFDLRFLGDMPPEDLYLKFVFLPCPKSEDDSAHSIITTITRKDFVKGSYAFTIKVPERYPAVCITEGLARLKILASVDNKVFNPIQFFELKK